MLWTHVALLKPTYSLPAIFFTKSITWGRKTGYLFKKIHFYRQADWILLTFLSHLFIFKVPCSTFNQLNYYHNIITLTFIKVNHSLFYSLLNFFFASSAIYLSISQCECMIKVMVMIFIFFIYTNTMRLHRSGITLWPLSTC